MNILLLMLKLKQVIFIVAKFISKFDILSALAVIDREHKARVRNKIGSAKLTRSDATNFDPVNWSQTEAFVRFVFRIRCCRLSPQLNMAASDTSVVRGHMNFIL